MVQQSCVGLWGCCGSLIYSTSWLTTWTSMSLFMTMASSRAIIYEYRPRRRQPWFEGTTGLMLLRFCCKTIHKVLYVAEEFWRQFLFSHWLVLVIDVLLERVAWNILSHSCPGLSSTASRCIRNGGSFFFFFLYRLIACPWPITISAGILGVY